MLIIVLKAMSIMAEYTNDYGSVPGVGVSEDLDRYLGTYPTQALIDMIR